MVAAGKVLTTSLLCCPWSLIMLIITRSDCLLSSSWSCGASQWRNRWGGRGPETPGGHSHWKGVWGCAAVMTPFFQASRRSLAHQFTVNAPLLCPLFSISRKFLHFQPCFGQNFSSLEPNFCSQDPHFLKENPLPRPYILKPAWHTPTKKKVECPPRAAFSVYSRHGTSRHGASR